jgi:hypothetical protein
MCAHPLYYTHPGVCADQYTLCHPSLLNSKLRLCGLKAEDYDCAKQFRSLQVADSGA